MGRQTFALLLLFTLASPAFAIPASAHAGILQAVSSTASSQGTCFGLNGVNDSFIPATLKSLRIAVVQPIFTSTPYSQYASGSFYAFYAKYMGVTANVTANLDWLNTPVSSGLRFNGGWGLSSEFGTFLSSATATNCGLVVGKNTQVVTDWNVSQGAFFDPQTHAAKYDVVVVPFSEYITVQEYQAYVNFVAGGGTLVTMAHSLEYPVTYNSTTGIESLMYAHGWANHGTYASPVPCASNSYNLCPWYANNTNWAGSNTCQASCFHTYKYNGSVVNTGSVIGKALSNEFGSVIFKSYKAHEENTITNMTGTSVVSVFVNDSKNLIASYTHQYKKGTVVCMCVFGDNVIASDPSAQYLLLLGIASSKLGPLYTQSTTTVITSVTTAGPSSSKSSTSTGVPTTVGPTTSVGQGISDSTSLVLVGVVAAVVVLAGAAIVLRRRTGPGG